MHGDYAVREFVEKHRAEEQHTGQDADGPSLRGTPLRVGLGKLQCPERR